MKSITLALCTVLLACSASAQDTSPIVADTLDWKRYYPLEIGNTWTYGGLNAYVATITADTLVNNRRYYIRRDSVLAVGTLGPFIHTFYVRYDTTARTVVTVPRLEADTLALPLPRTYRQAEWPDHLAYFHMDAPFQYCGQF
ncbi:MAG: hypothetical protein AAF730_18405 [Bacteroidota bacterium]